MKKILAPVLPALALLTLGGCASTSYLSTTEDDGMYYSSKDRVTAPAYAGSTATGAPAAATEEAPAAAPGDVANPDYAGSGSSAAAGSASQYYDDDYYYASRLRRFHSPYRGIGMGYYDFAYTDPYWYGGPALGYSPWGYGYNSFYDPFYSPWYGYGSGVTVTIGYGRPWGYGYGYGYSPYSYYGWGRPWGSPWGGYNYGYYNGYYSGLYNGYYGGGGYYGGWGNYYDRPGRRATYGARRDRAVDGQLLTADPTNSGGVSGRGRGRVQDGFTAPAPAPNGIVSQPAGGGRRRVQEVPETTTTPTIQPLPSAGRGRIAQDVPTQPGEMSTATNPAPPAGGGRRWRVVDNATNTDVSNPNGTSGQPAPVEYGRRRRADWSSDNSGNQPQPEQPRLADQPRRQRMYDQSSQPSQPGSEPSRSYSQPSRSYSQPSRSYSEPSRSYSEPSRSSSGGGGSNYGGGNSGGGGGGRRGRVQ